MVWQKSAARIPIRRFVDLIVMMMSLSGNRSFGTSSIMVFPANSGVGGYGVINQSETVGVLKADKGKATLL